MPTEYPPAVVAPTGTIGYDLYSWAPNASDQYPLQDGTYAHNSGHPVIHPAATGAELYRAGLQRAPSGEAPGSITFSGGLIIGMAGTGVGTFGIGLATAGAASWNEGAAMSVNAATGNLTCWTSTATGTNLPGYVSGGTQRGSTVSAISAGVAHTFAITVSATGNVRFVLDGAVIFDGAGGVDLIATSGATAPTVGLETSTNASAAALTALSVTYA